MYGASPCSRARSPLSGLALKPPALLVAHLLRCSLLSVVPQELAFRWSLAAAAFRPCLIPVLQRPPHGLASHNRPPQRSSCGSRHFALLPSPYHLADMRTAGLALLTLATASTFAVAKPAEGREGGGSLEALLDRLAEKANSSSSARAKATAAPGTPPAKSEKGKPENEDKEAKKEEKRQLDLSFEEDEGREPLFAVAVRAIHRTHLGILQLTTRSSSVFARSGMRTMPSAGTRSAARTPASSAGSGPTRSSRTTRQRQRSRQLG